MNLKKFFKIGLIFSFFISILMNGIFLLNYLKTDDKVNNDLITANKDILNKTSSLLKEVKEMQKDSNLEKKLNLCKARNETLLTYEDLGKKMKDLYIYLEKNKKENELKLRLLLGTNDLSNIQLNLTEVNNNEYISYIIYNEIIKFLDNKK